MGRNTRQGLPTATTPAGISLVTTDPAPMTLLSPMVTPGQMTTLPPIQTLLPMRTGLPNSTPATRGATASEATTTATKAAATAKPATAETTAPRAAAGQQKRDDQVEAAEYQHHDDNQHQHKQRCAQTVGRRGRCRLGQGLTTQHLQNGVDPGADALGVSAAFKCGKQLLLNDQRGLGVGQGAFEAITDFDAYLALSVGDQ